MLFISVTFDFRNFLRTGTLKNKFSTIKLQPFGHATGSCESKRPPSMCRHVPMGFSSVRVLRVTCATDAMDGRASPRNPMVFSVKRSSALRIFDVAWRSKARRASVTDMPTPSSTTCIDVRPAFIISTLIFVAPASTEFSISSFMTEAGRCMTSPAAI